MKIKNCLFLLSLSILPSAMAWPLPMFEEEETLIEEIIDNTRDIIKSEKNVQQSFPSSSSTSCSNSSVRLTDINEGDSSDSNNNSDSDSDSESTDNKTRELRKKLRKAEKIAEANADNFSEEQRNRYQMTSVCYSRSFDCYTRAKNIKANSLKSQEIAACWEKFSDQYQIYAEYWAQAASLFNSSNQEEAKRLDNYALEGTKLDTAYNYLENALKAKNPEIANCLTQAAQQTIAAIVATPISSKANESTTVLVDQETNSEGSKEQSLSELSASHISSNNQTELEDEENKEEWNFVNTLKKSAKNWVQAAIYLSQADQEEIIRNVEKAKLLRKAAAYRRQKALERDNNDLESECDYHIDAERAPVKNIAAEETYKKSLEAYQEKEKALARGDKDAAALYEKQAKALGGTSENPGATYAYEQAANMQLQGNKEAAEAWNKGAQTYEKQAKELIQGNTFYATVYGEMANLLGGGFLENNQLVGTGIAYECAAISQVEENTNAIEVWNERARLYEALTQRMELAINRQDEEQTRLLIKEVKDEFTVPLKRAAERTMKLDSVYNTSLNDIHSHAKAQENKAKGNEKAAAVWLRSAQAFEKCKEIIGKETSEKDDETIARLYRHMGIALGEGEAYCNPGAGFVYEDQLSNKMLLNCARVREEEARMLQAAIEAFSQETPILAELYQKAAQVLGGSSRTIGACFSYLEAYLQEKVNEESSSSIKAAQCYENQAKALKAAIDAHKNENREVARLYEKKAQALGGNHGTTLGVGFCYFQSGSAASKKDIILKEIWFECAQTYEEQSNALQSAIDAHLSGNGIITALHQKRVLALGDACDMYHNAITMRGQPTINEDRCKLFIKGAQSYQSQEKAFKDAINAYQKENEDIAKLYEKKAQALGGHFGKAGVAFTYGMQASASQLGRSKEHILMCGKIGMTYEEVARVWEDVIQTYEKGDQFAIELYQKIVQVLDGDTNNPAAAQAYWQAAVLMKDNVKENEKTAKAWFKCAEKYKEAAEAFNIVLKIYLTGNISSPYESIAELVQKSAYYYGSAAIALQNREGEERFNECLGLAQLCEDGVKTFYAAIKTHKAKNTVAFEDKTSLVVTQPILSKQQGKAGFLGLQRGFFGK